MRWNSFQFLVAWLAMDLLELHASLNRVLPKLPVSRVQGRWQGMQRKGSTRSKGRLVIYVLMRNTTGAYIHHLFHESLLGMEI